MDADNTLILDAATLTNANFTLQIGALRVGALELSDTGPVPGWLRRLSPPDWQRGVSLESHESAVKAAWLALIVAITQDLRGIVAHRTGCFGRCRKQDHSDDCRSTARSPCARDHRHQ
jgi:hypothetical protein